MTENFLSFEIVKDRGNGVLQEYFDQWGHEFQQKRTKVHQSTRYSKSTYSDTRHNYGSNISNMNYSVNASKVLNQNVLKPGSVDISHLSTYSN